MMDTIARMLKAGMSVALVAVAMAAVAGCNADSATAPGEVSMDKECYIIDGELYCRTTGG